MPLAFAAKACEYEAVQEAGEKRSLVKNLAGAERGGRPRRRSCNWQLARPTPGPHGPEAQDLAEELATGAPGDATSDGGLLRTAGILPALMSSYQ
jgi:hypothetical protein